MFLFSGAVGCVEDGGSVRRENDWWMREMAGDGNQRRKNAPGKGKLEVQLLCAIGGDTERLCDQGLWRRLRGVDASE